MHEKIFRVAREWCCRNPGWRLICDIPDTESLYKTWQEMPKRYRDDWERIYHSDAESAWKEFGRAVCKVPYGFVGTDGVFYPEITDVPTNTNSCQVFKVREEKTKWKIEYEIPPLRAIMWTFADGKYTEQEAREAFSKAEPNGLIRKIHKVTSLVRPTTP